MLAIADLGRVPRQYGVAATSPLAAKLALALAGDGEIRGRYVAAPEIHALEHQLQARLDAATASLDRLRCGVRVDMIEDTYRIWLVPGDEDYIGAVWTLEQGWAGFERSAPGLAATALLAIANAQRASLPVLTPGEVAGMAEFVWWRGEPDETLVLDELREELPKGAPLPEDHGVPLRADFDRALPRFVQRPRPLSRGALERDARGRGTAGDLARATLALLDATRTTSRTPEPEFVTQGENGELCFAYAGALRWNGKDPTFQVFDDYGRSFAECDGVDCAYGFFHADDPAGILPIWAAVERRLAVAARMEPVLELLGTRWRA